MQTDKFKVLLYLKKSGLDKSGQAPIMGRITYGRTIAQFSCKLSCDPKLWNARESRLNGKSREAVATNGKLERLLLAVQSAYRVLCERGVVFTATDIKEQFQGSMQSQTTFLERYDRMVEEMEQKVGIEIKATTMRVTILFVSICKPLSVRSTTRQIFLSVRLKKTSWSACNITLSESWDIRKVIIVRWLCQ